MSTTGDDINHRTYRAVRMLALTLGREADIARQYVPSPITDEGALREATTVAAARTDMRDDLTTQAGDGVLRLAVKMAWGRLVREGTMRETPIERPGRRRRGRSGA